MNAIREYYYILMSQPYTKTFDICSSFPSFLLLSLCPSASDLVTGKSNLTFRVRHTVLIPLYCAAMEVKKKNMIVIFYKETYKGLQGKSS